MEIGRRHGPTLPAELSRSTDKLDLYATDTDFIESWEDLLTAQRVIGDLPLSQLASLTLKPDAVVGRTLHPALDWLEEHGFRVVDAEPVEFNRHMIRDIWRYSWNVASADRKELVDVLLTMTPSLFIALRGPEDASLWLSQTKGPANPAYREPGQLRFKLGSFSTLLNFVHTSDEPADLVRELGVFFPSKLRQRIYQRLAYAEPSPRARKIAAELEGKFPSHDLDHGRCLDRVTKAIAKLQHGSEFHAEALDDLASGDVKALRTLVNSATAGQLRCDPWDVVVLGTHAIRMDDPNLEPVVPGISSMHLPATATEIG